MKKLRAYISIGWRVVAIVLLILVGFTVDALGQTLTKFANSIERLCERIVKEAPTPPWL